MEGCPNGNLTLTILNNFKQSYYLQNFGNVSSVWEMYSLPSVVSFLGNQPIQRRRSSLIRGVSPEHDSVGEEVTNDDIDNEVKCSEYQTKKAAREEGFNILECAAEHRADREAIREDLGDNTDDDINTVHQPQGRVTQVRQSFILRHTDRGVLSLPN